MPASFAAASKPAILFARLTERPAGMTNAMRRAKRDQVRGGQQAQLSNVVGLSRPGRGKQVLSASVKRFTKTI